jgi:hypothetical protein
MDSADRDRKKVWKQRGREAARSAFPLPDDQLQSMFRAVEAQIGEHGCDHSHRFTSEWLAENQQPVEKVVGWLEAHGGYCDCEVAANAYDHWMQNKSS